jgi:hypothetical protein
MITWEERLRSWNFPEEKIESLVLTLERFGLDPGLHVTPFDLARSLRSLERNLRTMGISLPPEIVDFFKWLIEQIRKFVEENFAALSLIVAGGIASALLRGWTKAVGIIPVVGGVVLLLRKHGVI